MTQANDQTGNVDSGVPQGHATSMRVFSIPPGAPFLKVLALALIDGSLVPGFVPANDPLLLPTATIYLPTRRAARALSAEFIDAFGGKAALLPVIRTLGDGEADEFDFTAGEEAACELPPPIGDLERRLHLARLVRGWTGALAQSTRDLFGDEDIVIPSSASEAIRMSGDLARLIDAMETEEIGWEKLALIDGQPGPDDTPERWAQWWNLTLKFLDIVRRHWPDFLRERQRSDPASHRGRLLGMRTTRLLRHGSKGPVIAAGSTGSIPATSRLIQCIAGFSNGAVVLPGLDTNLDGDVWEALCAGDAQDGTLALCTHPQYGLARLLRAIGIDRREVVEIGHTDRAARMRMIGRAMLPAGSSERWAIRGEAPADAQGIVLIEAPNGRMEALSIAIALREALETPGKTAALVTPDRMLAQRVAAELGRFGIAIDDSGGTPLRAAPPATLARLALAACAAASGGLADPVTLVALMKHPVTCGSPQGASARIARLFELAVLRDAIIVPQPGGLEAAAKAALAAHDSNPHAPAEVREMAPAERTAVISLGARFDTALSPLTQIAARGENVPVAAMIEALRLSLGNLLEGEARQRYLSLPGASALQRLFDSFSTMDDPGLDIAPHEFADVFDALLESESVQDTRAHHPRLSILGPLEARLQRADRVILGGLNEGTWPGQSRNDPFLNRPMRAGMGLSTPERRIGQAAHDFQQLSGPGELIYTRSLRSGNAPTVASRWLQRLMVVAGKEAGEAMRAAGARYLFLAKAADRSKEKARRVARPNPRPPVAMRPTGLSVTEIETWIRDPYAIHAKHILDLRPLPPLERKADPMLRGQIYHQILARFVTSQEPGSSGARMEQIARAVFAEYNVPREVAATWLPRFMAIGRLFIAWEDGRRDGIASSHCEISGRIEIDGFRLRGRADRIDITTGGQLSIIDYKTGMNPSIKQARNLSPQLALEGKMAALGAFGALLQKRVGELAYVRLRAGESLKVDEICGGRDPVEPAALMDRAFEQLQSLITGFRIREQGYLSRRAPSHESDLAGDYDHLARVREWSSAEEGGDE